MRHGGEQLLIQAVLALFLRHAQYTVPCHLFTLGIYVIAQPLHPVVKICKGGGQGAHVCAPYRTATDASRAVIRCNSGRWGVCYVAKSVAAVECWGVMSERSAAQNVARFQLFQDYSGVAGRNFYQSSIQVVDNSALSVSTYTLSVHVDGHTLR